MNCISQTFAGARILFSFNWENSALGVQEGGGHNSSFCRGRVMNEAVTLSSIAIRNLLCCNMDQYVWLTFFASENLAALITC
jgi:hypothetical protein